MTHTEIETQCCVVGGGPAGMMLAFLLARAGVRTVVLEKHADFLRDFRGDTVHPSTLRLMDELGLLDEFLKLPHQRLNSIEGDFGARHVKLADFSHLPQRYNFVAFMPQWDFLNFLAERFRAFKNGRLLMETEATDLIVEGDQIRGVRARSTSNTYSIRASITIAADGRHSTLRECAGFKRKDIGAPIDVLWFRIPRDPDPFNNNFTHVVRGQILITLDRGNYWQCAYVIAKDTWPSIQAAGIEQFKQHLVNTAPSLAKHIVTLSSWDQIKLLTVVIDRLERWSRDGFLCIGDSAHAMSPVGGVGINLAIQDAVAAANLLTQKIVQCTSIQAVLSDRELDLVRKRRLFPTRVVQRFQVLAQNRILAPILSGDNATLEIPLPFRLLNRFALLRRIPAYFIGMGIRSEHIRS